MQRLDITLDHTLEEYRRLGYARLGPMFEDAEGELLPVHELPQEDRQTGLQLLAVKQRALDGILRYLRHARMYGQPEPRNLTVNNTVIVPIERLTDEELDLYEAMAAKGRAIPIESAVLPPEPEQK
jgi:hypothetical protein